ncbi:MAG: transcription termination factor Rho [Candidatus Shikimatogenerans sp. AspAUS03]|uniref:Transcription termination factor Rho n=1 Tax=Candidatus Shikimatogenerans sp. AspAUS03 TaxID=3158563 RepID=A0AAU7QT81_9FLAO
MNINLIKLIKNSKIKKILKKIKLKYSIFNRIILINKIIKYIKNYPLLKNKYKYILNGGILEKKNDYGYLRSFNFNYLKSKEDIYISKNNILKYKLKTGDTVLGYVLVLNNKYIINKIKYVNGYKTKYILKHNFEKKILPIFPNKKFNLSNNYFNLSTRLIDIFAPIGMGQRALFVAPPKVGKTRLLKDCAKVILKNHSNVYMIVLLIDERPEEVTDIKYTINSEVIYSTFDEKINNHIKISNLVIKKSIRLMKFGYDVIIFLDSLTRLTRAYNIYNPNSGKILSGGIDANALEMPKKFFGSARNIKNGGSLTIIASIITETGSKMDDIIFEEFKGTGNMEIQLDKNLANKKIYPAINLITSSTRRDDLLFKPNIYQKITNLKKYLFNYSLYESIEFIVNKINKTKNNKEFFNLLN